MTRAPAVPPKRLLISDSVISTCAIFFLLLHAVAIFFHDRFPGFVVWAQAVCLACLIVPVITVDYQSKLPLLMGFSGKRWFAIWTASWLPCLVVGALALHAYLQSLRWPVEELSWFAPQVCDAYTQLDRIGIQTASDGRFPATIDLHDSYFDRSKWLTLAGFALFGRMVFDEPKRIFFLFYGLVAIAVAVCIAGILETMRLPSEDYWKEYQKNVIGHPFGPFANRNNLGIVAVLGLSGVLGLTFRRGAARRSGYISKNRSSVSSRPISNSQLLFVDQRCLGTRPAEQGVLVVAAVIIVFSVLVSGSRGSLLGLLPAALLIGFKISSKARIALPLAAWVLGGCVFVLGLFLVLSNSPTGNRLLGSAKTVREDARLPHWLDAANASISYFPLGAGLGAYGPAMIPFVDFTHSDNFPSHYQRAVFSVTYPFPLVPERRWTTSADSQWVQWSVEAGLIGWILFATFTISGLICLAGLSAARRSSDNAIGLAGWAMLAGLLVTQSLDSSLSNSVVAALLVVSASAIALRFAAIQEPLPELADRAKASLSSDVQRPEEIGVSGSSRNILAILAQSIKSRAFRAQYATRVRIAMLLFVSVVLAANAHTSYAFKLTERLAMDCENWLATKNSSKSLPGIQYQIERLQTCSPREQSDPELLLDLAVLHLLMCSHHGSEIQQTTANRGELIKTMGGSMATPTRDTPSDYPVDLEIVESLCEKALSLRPTSDRARFYLIQVSREKRDLARASALLTDLVHIRRKSPLVLLDIGRIACDVGNPDIAIAAWTKCIEQAPRLIPNVLTALSNVKDRLPHDAFLEIEQAISRQAVEYHLARARLLDIQPDAIKFHERMLKKSLQFDQQTQELLAQLGDALSRRDGALGSDQSAESN